MKRVLGCLAISAFAVIPSGVDAFACRPDPQALRDRPRPPLAEFTASGAPAVLVRLSRPLPWPSCALDHTSTESLSEYWRCTAGLPFSHADVRQLHCMAEIIDSVNVTFQLPEALPFTDLCSQFPSCRGEVFAVPFEQGQQFLTRGASDWRWGQGAWKLAVEFRRQQGDP